MLRPRLIPAVLIRDGSVIKTVGFGESLYIGDPCNTIRVFNELEVDELLITDITERSEYEGPDFELVEYLAEEAFMPVCYSGSVKTLRDAERLFRIGIEKIAVNTAAIKRPEIIKDITGVFGAQSLAISIDVKREVSGKPYVYNRNLPDLCLDPVKWAKDVERLGAGEILLTSIDKEGTWSGYDLEIIKDVSSAVGLPVIAQGGAGTLEDVALALSVGQADAAAVGSMFMFQKKGFGVLVHYPDSTRIDMLFNSLGRLTEAK